MQSDLSQLMLPWDHSVLGFTIALFLAPLASVFATKGFKARTIAQGTAFTRAIIFDRSSKPFGYWLCLAFYALVALECFLRIGSQLLFWASRNWPA